MWWPGSAIQTERVDFVNDKRFWLNADEHFVLKKEDRVADAHVSSRLSKIFLLEFQDEYIRRFFYDGDTDEAVLDKVSIKPFKRRKMKIIKG